MPFAITHVLIAMIIAELLRDYVFKKKFPLYYVLLAGIAGMLPDIDVVFAVLCRVSVSALIQGKAPASHPSFTHSILWIPIFLILGFVFLQLEKKGKMKAAERMLKKHRMAISGILFICALGIAVHLALDATLTGYLRLGFFTDLIGLNLIPPTQFGSMIISSIDAVLLILWLVHGELKHHISRFI